MNAHQLKLLTELSESLGRTVVRRKEVTSFFEEKGYNRPPDGAALRALAVTDKNGNTVRATYDIGPLIGQQTIIGNFGEEVNTPDNPGTVVNVSQRALTPEPVEDTRTDEEILKEMSGRFDLLIDLTEGLIAGDLRAMVVPGNPGIGKTYNMDKKLTEAHAEGRINYTSVRGKLTPTGLVRMLYAHRDEENVIVIDDSDSVFGDEVSLGLLKIALDSGHSPRKITWKSAHALEEDGEIIPDVFEFKGRIAFISNKDFRREIARGTKISPHLDALMSRSLMVDLNLGSKRNIFLWVKNVANTTSILDNIPAGWREEVLGFMERHFNDMEDISLRTLEKLSGIMKICRGNFEDFRTKAELLMVQR